MKRGATPSRREPRRVRRAAGPASPSSHQRRRVLQGCENARRALIEAPLSADRQAFLRQAGTPTLHDAQCPPMTEQPAERGKRQCADQQ